MVSGPVFVGMDAGLTSTKAVVIDGDGHVLGSAARPAAREEGPGGRSERDLLDQWTTCCAVLREALERAAIPVHQVEGIGIAGHGDGLILIGEGGMPVRPGVLSLDSRSREIVAGLERDGSGQEIAAETGYPPRSGRPVTLLLWMLEHEEESLRAARWILFTKDWIKLRLTGRATTDFTDASAGLLCRSRPEYALPVLHKLGLGEILPKLPEIVPSAGVAGGVSAEAAEATGLRHGIPVASGSHDASASVVGAGALGPGAVCLIAGTWSSDVMVSQHTSVSITAASQGVYARWFLDGVRSLLFSSSPSGIELLNRLRELVVAAPTNEYDLLAGLLGEENAAGGANRLPTVIPSLIGLGPSRHSGAVVLGLECSDCRAKLGRALAQAMAFRHRLGYELLSGEVPIAEVRVTGGLSQSDRWSQLLADTLGREVVRPLCREAGASGAAAMAGVAAGAWESVDDASRAVGVAGATFGPREEQKTCLDERYGRYVSVLQRLASLC
jgi:L-xylulokinase